LLRHWPSALPALPWGKSSARRKTRSAGASPLTRPWPGTWRRIKANVEGTYNKDQVVEAANVVQAIANSKMGALFQPGTDKGKGWKETRVKPEFFKPESKDELGKLAGGYNKEANEMARVAATGDLGAIKTQFGKLGESCKACHDKFRKDE
jgi:cytochrome c556